MMAVRMFVFMVLLGLLLSAGCGFLALGGIYGVWWGYVESVRDFIVLCKGDVIGAVDVGWLLFRFFILAGVITGTCFTLGGCCFMLALGMIGAAIGEPRGKSYSWRYKG